MNRQYDSPTGAKAIIANSTVSTGATWSEDVEIVDSGSFVTDADTIDWRFTFRKCADSTTSPQLTLSTDDSTLTIAQGSASTTLQIRVPPESLTAMEGDYIADLASMDDDDNVTHWAHGTVTFLYEPPVWS